MIAHAEVVGLGGVEGNMESKVHKEYVALRPKNLGTVGELLGRHGLEFDRMLNSMVRGSMSAAQGGPPLAIYCAEALIWTRHAQRGDDFVRAACNYLIHGTPEALELATEAAWRFGPEKLSGALQAFRQFLSDTGVSDLPVSIPDLQRLQGEYMDMVATAKDNHRMRGLGPWLFLAPFKIHITHHPELWDDQDLDAVTMPLGTAVGRSLKELVRDGIIAAGGTPIEVPVHPIQETGKRPTASLDRNRTRGGAHRFRSDVYRNRGGGSWLRNAKGTTKSASGATGSKSCKI